MFDFLSNIPQDLHPLLVHFPVALLSLSFLLWFWSRRSAGLRETEWLLFAAGALGTLPATITGLVAHAPYEESTLAEVIQPHQLVAMLGTPAILALLVWRWRCRRRRDDIVRRPWYLALALAGLAWIFIVGGTGGSLVYDHAINVRDVNPLLP